MPNTGFGADAKLDPALAGPMGRKSIFRIYRDVRFSKNKDPFKTHFSAYFTASGKDIETPGYYVQIGPNGNTLIGGGWYMPIKTNWPPSARKSTTTPPS